MMVLDLFWPVVIFVGFVAVLFIAWWWWEVDNGIEDDIEDSWHKELLEEAEAEKVRMRDQQDRLRRWRWKMKSNDKESEDDTRD